MSEETQSPKEKKYYDNISMGQRTKQSVYFVAQHDKATMLESYLQKIDDQQTVVIVNSKLAADELNILLNAKEIKSVAAHGNHRPEQLEAASKGFNDREFDVLITTDMIFDSSPQGARLASSQFIKRCCYSSSPCGSASFVAFGALAGATSAGWSIFAPIPSCSWIRFSISLAKSRLSLRKVRAFSFPCPN